MPAGADQARLLKCVEMPRDRLSAEGHIVVLNQPSAQLKQALIVPFLELIENDQPRVVAKRAEELAQIGIKRNAHILIMQHMCCV